MPSRVDLHTIINATTLRLLRGDITLQDTDAIVNAANSGLMGGGGVDGAIHRAGGAQILKECQDIRAERGPLSAGEAVITSGGKLKTRYVIHTVGPVWQGGTHNEETLLAACYRNSLRLAQENGIRTIAFPSISTGAYGFPAERAANIAFEAVSAFARSDAEITEVRFVVFSQLDEAVYHLLIQSLR
jgi:O-acetyl-ADP-ribose deacetylase (regulator of RNase III)